MTNDFLYEIIIDFLKKDRRGNVYTESDHDRELKRMNILYMDKILPMYEMDQDITDKIDKFKTVITVPTLTYSSNLIDKPIDYARHDYLAYKQDGDSSKTRSLDVLVGSQWSARQGSSIFSPSERFPVCRYRGGYIEFLPSTLNPNYFEYSYIKYPAEPTYDGYYDASGNFVYLAPGGSRVLQTDEVGLDGTTSGTYNSSSVELEWGDDDKLNIADMILRSLGIVLNEPLITQYKDQEIKEG